MSNTKKQKSNKKILKKDDKTKEPPFPYTLPYKELNLRENPHLYRIGKGEQGVLMVQPYKSELCYLWKFKNPEIATKSSNELMKKFYEYLLNNDFIGCDMVRKYIQMGITRSRRYANHSSGKKYKIGNDGKEKYELPKESINKNTNEKYLSSLIFEKRYNEIMINKDYLLMSQNHKNLYNHIPIKDIIKDVKLDQINHNLKKISLYQQKKTKNKF
jgi:hypothetical protein